MTECFKALLDRIRRMEPFKNHFLNDKRCMLVACAGGTGRGVTDCLMDMEKVLTHMGMRTYDRISVVRFNKDYMLPALEGAGKQYTLDLIRLMEEFFASHFEENAYGTLLIQAEK